jgi:hypothetical protein
MQKTLGLSYLHRRIGATSGRLWLQVTIVITGLLCGAVALFTPVR